MHKEIFSRSIALLGEEKFNLLAEKSIVIFGVGGVGGWCAEALLRTGAAKITLVDDDIVVHSNINRQRQAIPSTVGQLKVDVLKKHLGDINPIAQINAVSKRYTPENAHLFSQILNDSDYIIDAIDSVDCKMHLISNCLTLSKEKNISIFSSMGAALRTDPTKVRIAPFHKVTGDGLAKALRNRFRKSNIAIPKHLCVFSEELPDAKTVAKGSIMPVTCSFGMALASLVVKTVDEQSIQGDTQLP